MSKTVMIVGSGAREHVISKAYEKSAEVSTIVVTPGNDYMKVGRSKQIIIDKDASLKDATSILKAAQRHHPDLIEVAQDDALAAGTVDLLQEHGFTVFGPTQAAARIEWDKAWSREFMKKYGIKTPWFEIFSDVQQAKAVVKEKYQNNADLLLYIKASGLAAGKGALQAENLEQALDAIDAMQSFGSAGTTFLVEQGLVGEEFSIYTICNGKQGFTFNSAQDNKLLNEGDSGPQTGGMGSISPALVTLGYEVEIQQQFIDPVLKGMATEGHPYVGILYLSGMLTADGIYCIEYNSRWGDPECQVVLPAVQNDYYQLVVDTLEGKQVEIQSDQLYRICVVGASKGYPVDYAEVKGQAISGLESLTDVELYSAGIRITDGVPVAAGGRLFSVVAAAPTLVEASKVVYKEMQKLDVGKGLLHYRKDIGRRDIERVEQQDTIAIIDFGGQYVHLIGRRLRDLGILPYIFAYDQVPELDSLNLKGIILSGGPRSVGESDSPEIPEIIRQILDTRSLPVLGICYGHQLLGSYYGGSLSRSTAREYGPTTVEVLEPSSLIHHQQAFKSWMSHGDHVEAVGPGFTITAKSENCPVVAMESADNKIYGVQFHPEVTHTDGGQVMLERFVRRICAIKSKSWTMAMYRSMLVEQMRKEVGNQKVLLGVSGGVDSLVASLVLREAIGEQLHCVFIDHGLLRLHEAAEVEGFYHDVLHFPNFHAVDASETFFSKLQGVSDPEAKRKIIGHTFIEIFEKIAKSLESEYGTFECLGQGTIYSDRIESGAVGAGSEKIKSHHNLTLPEDMKFKVIEPIKELYKDEVRQLGRVLGAPEQLINRYPFPGPGLAVRVIGQITPEQVHILQEADHIFLEELKKTDPGDAIWQAFAVLLPVRAVGVQGDNRAYGQIVALRAVKSHEGMTADFSRLDYEMLSRISSRIINEVKEVTRVVYDISTKPPATIEFE